MMTLKSSAALVAVLLTSAGLAPQCFSQGTAATPGVAAKPAGAKPSEAEMMAMMTEMAKPGKNHEILAGLVGSWKYTLKFWMVPGAPPSESSGTAVRKPILDGRYFVLDSAGKVQMPGPDGKMTDVEFKGISMEGYDNVKKKFVSTWMDNMGTSIILSEGTYDPATTTFTYLYQEEMFPGVITKVRQTVKIINKDHHTYEWFEDRGGKETETMELACTRQK